MTAHPTPTADDTRAFAGASGELARLIAAHDWSPTLGPIDGWPGSLRTAVGVLLYSPVPIVLLWGTDGIMLYNDAYAVFAGARHPALLGTKVREGWPEVASFNDHVMKVGLAGGTLSYKNQELTLDRTGTPAQAWMNLDYSPVIDETGKPGGVIAIVVETTDGVLSERRLAAATARQRRQFEQAPGFVIIMSGPDHVVDFVNETHKRVFGSHDWVGRPIRDAFPSIEGQGFFDELDKVYRTGTTFETSGAEVRYRKRPDAPLERRYLSFIYAPVTEDDGTVTGIFCDGFDVTARERAEMALHRSQERLSAALDAMAMGTFAWDPDADRADGDARMRALFGLARDDTLSLARALAERIHPHDAQRYAAAVAQSVHPKGSGRLREDIRVRLPDGAERWLTITGQVQFDDTRSRAVRMVGTAVDVTESKIASEALRESEALFRFLDALGVNTASQTDADAIMAVTTRMVGEHLGIAVCAYADMDADQDGFTIRGDWTMPGLPSIVGHYKLADFGTLAVERLSAGQPLIVNDIVRELAAEDAATFARIGVAATICMPLVKEGRLTALMAGHDKVPRQWTGSDLALLREVTQRSWAHVERVAAAAELRANEHTFRTLARAMPNHVWTSRPDGELDWFNEQVYAYSGVAAGQLDGARWASIIHPDDLPAAIERWAHALAHGTLYQAEFRIRRHDGEWHWHLARAVPLLADSGQIVRWIGTNTDIQDQKEVAQALVDINATLEQRVDERTHQLVQAQDALRQAQKMEAVGQLTGGIAHDFNNLLMGITGSLQLLERRLSEGKFTGVERYIDAAQGSARRAAALTQRLLAFSRRQTLDPRPTDINRLVAGMEELLRRSVGPTVEVEVVGAGGLWATRIDRSQLENSLLNLCINARDAMAPKGGRLTIETGNKWLDERAAKERDLPPGQYVSLCVTDTGTGMTPEVIDRAFDPFFTTKPLGQGTGLGLSMVYGFVRQSGGQVRIYSHLGKGTTMCLYLPRFSGEVALDDEASEQQADAGHGETILVIDDEATVRMLIVDVLKENGYRVLEAETGAGGLAQLRGSERVDVLITDVGLPGGMNGRQVADAARVERPDLKVLFITGYAENAVDGNGLLDPGMEVMTKPFNTVDLANRVRELIDRSGN